MSAWEAEGVSDGGTGEGLAIRDGVLGVDTAAGCDEEPQGEDGGCSRSDHLR